LRVLLAAGVVTFAGVVAAAGAAGREAGREPAPWGAGGRPWVERVRQTARMAFSSAKWHAELCAAGVS
ncbi:hypothetical protein AB0K46_24110, partial [Streptomyces cinnamoneus]